MEHQSVEPVSMLRFVLAFMVVKVAAAGALLLYASSADTEPPVSSTAITIAAVGAAVLWFMKAVNRPMNRSEIAWFSIGNTLAELALSVAWVFGMIWLSNTGLSWESLGQVFGGDAQAAKTGVMFGVTAGLLPVPILSALFGWLMTKNLPSRSTLRE